MLRAGLVSATFKQLTHDQIIELILDNKLHSVEWSENWHIPENEVSVANTIRQACARAGIEIAALGSYYRLGEEDDFNKRIELAKSLGAPLIRIWGGRLASSQIEKELWDSMVDEARRCSQEAAQEGLKVALEWHKMTITDTNESAMAFLQEVNRSNFLTLWQPTQALSIEQRLTGLSELKGHFANIHIYHWDTRGRRPLSEGKEEWMKYLQIANDMNDHEVLLEFVRDDSVSQFEEDCRTLHGWLQNFDEKRNRRTI